MKGKEYIRNVKLVWQALQWLEVILISSGVAVMIFFLTGSFLYAAFAEIVVFILTALVWVPWQITQATAAKFIDSQMASAEYSAGLILTSPDQLSVIGRLQQAKISKELSNLSLLHILPPNRLGRSILIAAGCIVVGILGRWVVTSTSEAQIETTGRVPLSIITDLDESSLPRIVSADVVVAYPSYTRVGKVEMDSLHVKALVGSRISWYIEVSGEVDSVILETVGAGVIPFKKTNSSRFQGEWMPVSDALYSLRIVRDSLQAVSAIYSIQLLPDESPDVLTPDMSSFVTFSAGEESKNIHVKARATDDYGLTEAYVVATVSSGSGESVRFRERQFSLSGFKPDEKDVVLTRTISLDSLNMVPGDELYYYIEVKDNKLPVKGIGKSETFFAVIEDTVTQEFMTAGSLGVDLMPDYFRSQRQLILDTEKLIAERSSISSKTFNQRSNELGYDQKLLRLKYGQYLGEEFESGITEDTETLNEALQDEEKDPTAAYTHDHDADEESQVPAHDHQEEDEEGGDPLESYLHEHSDPEEATLYTAGIRAMLKQAMAEMWDAELYLRLYQPAESLPYQYKALNLIQKIKNHARIYVQRIGFDPPPVKEETRLTGDLEAVANPIERTDIDFPEPHQHIRQAITFLANLENNKPDPDIREKIISPAADELAKLALEKPGLFLSTLSTLKKIEDMEWEAIPWKEITPGLLKGLSEALPPSDYAADGRVTQPLNTLDSLYFIQIEGKIND